MLKEDGSSLQDESMEVSKAEGQLVEGLGKLLAGGSQICRDGFELLTEQARGKFMILLVKGGVQIVMDIFWIVHGGWKQWKLGRLLHLETNMQK